ncbi:MAG: hypothetical protein R2825_28015 [Saprospiraceae bacterium]
MQTDLTDEVVEDAWKNIPPEAQDESAEKMVDILKQEGTTCWAQRPSITD